MGVEAGGNGAGGADHEALLVTAVHEFAELGAQFLFAVAGRGRGEHAVFGHGLMLEHGGRERTDAAHAGGLDEGLRHELEGLEPLEGVAKIGAPDDDAMVF